MTSRLRAGPDADLSHLPVSLNLRAVSLAEGVRAALSVAAIVAVNEWAGIPALTESALGALLTCLCDAGGPIRRRLPVLFAFAVLGSLITAGFGLLRAQGLAAAVPCACALIFCTSFARAWGPSPMQVGNLLTVVAVLALDRAADLHAALELGGMFLAGSLWALALTMVIWRLHPYRPARRAVAELFQRLAVLAGDLSALLATGNAKPDWAAHARAHRRHVRDGIEQARTLVLDTIRSRGPGNARASQLLIQVEAADQVFGAMIALRTCWSRATRPPRTPRGISFPHSASCSPPLRMPSERNRPIPTAAHRAMTERLLAEFGRDPVSPALSGITNAILERLRIAALLTTPEGASPDGISPSSPEPLGMRLLAPLRANLTWGSAALRHATRAAAVAAPALAFTLSSGATYAHWLTITLVLTLQPFFALTWQRALERSAGTVLGGVAAAAIAALVHTPLATAAVLFPLAVLAFTVRAVSYGLFMACLTPLVVLLSEIGRPGASELVIAAWRAGFTVLGGTLAVLGGALLWPSWEPGRVRQELRTAIRAHAAYADLELAILLGASDPAAADAARRAAGVATNNLEASLSRALQEPRRSARAGLQAAMLADAALRRMAGRLSALQHEPGLATGCDLHAWRSWLAAAFAALDSGTPSPGQPPPDGRHGSLARIARQLELMEGALRPAEEAQG